MNRKSKIYTDLFEIMKDLKNNHQVKNIQTYMIDNDSYYFVVSDYKGNVKELELHTEVLSNDFEDSNPFTFLFFVINNPDYQVFGKEINPEILITKTNRKKISKKKQL